MTYTKSLLSTENGHSDTLVKRQSESWPGFAQMSVAYIATVQLVDRKVLLAYFKNTELDRLLNLVVSD